MMGIMWAYMQFALFLFYFKYIVFLGFQFPLLFLTFHLFAVRILLQLRNYILRRSAKQIYQRHSRNRQQLLNEKNAPQHLPSSQIPHTQSSYLLTVTAGATTALSLACFLLALPRIRSPAFIYMLLPVYSALQYTFTSSSAITSTTLISFFACIVSSCLILLNETSVDSNGIALLAESALFWTARCLLRRDKPAAFNKSQELAMVGGIIVGVLAVKLEDVGLAVMDFGEIDGQTFALHFVANVLLNVGLAVPFLVDTTDGGDITGKGEEKDQMLKLPSEVYGGHPLQTTLEGVLLLSLGRLFPSYLSYPQIVAYAILRVFVYQLRPQTSKNITDENDCEEGGEEDEEYAVVIDVETVQLSTRKKSGSSKSLAAASWLILPVLVVVLMRVQFHLWLTDSLSHPTHVTFDTSLDNSPRQPFEIVISAHNRETSEQIHKFIIDLQSLDVFAGSNPDITIYTTSIPTSSSPSSLTTYSNFTAEFVSGNNGRIKVVTDKTISTQSAYLHHITNNWDSLTTQTLFASMAHNHREREVLLYRLRRYFTPERTGFLSLSDNTSTCRCGSCSDITGFRLPGATEFVKAISPDYECDGYSTIPLTQGGNFVASGRRIKGVGKVVYEGLKRHLEGRGRSSMGGEETVERLWGVVMRCTDERVVAMCSGTPRFGGLLGEQEVRRLDECQCLDF